MRRFSLFSLSSLCLWLYVGWIGWINGFLLVDVMVHLQHVYCVLTILIFLFPLLHFDVILILAFFLLVFSITSPRRGFPFFCSEISRISASNSYLAFLFVWYTLAPLLPSTRYLMDWFDRYM
ncbi:hypothetical protein DFP73DRAFT_192276 [Morchella snyderi]|nr:hypothetical protein DFP73DRAFT_192276 [Morchella snyderi]